MTVLGTDSSHGSSCALYGRSLSRAMPCAMVYCGDARESLGEEQSNASAVVSADVTDESQGARRGVVRLQSRYVERELRDRALASAGAAAVEIVGGAVDERLRCEDE